TTSWPHRTGRRVITLADEVPVNRDICDSSRVMIRMVRRHAVERVDALSSRRPRRRRRTSTREDAIHRDTDAAPRDGPAHGRLALVRGRRRERGPMKAERIWWREITPEDLYAMEKSSRGLRGRTALEVRPVPHLLHFLGLDRAAQDDTWDDVRIVARVVGDPDVSAPLVFKAHRRHGVYELPSQNRHDDRHERHPAWLPEHGWPDVVPGSVEEAKQVIADLGGLHVYLARVES